MQNVIGRIVTSKAGRDKGSILVVIGVVDDNNVLVSDGRLRKVDNPKKKKIKHLNISNIYLDKIAEKIKNDEVITNSEVRREISDLNLV